jgi:hypothetical protein
MAIRRFKDFLKGDQFSEVDDPFIGTGGEVKKDFDRTEFYYEYYKNLTPPDFDIQREGDVILIRVNGASN